MPYISQFSQKTPNKYVVPKARALLNATGIVDRSCIIKTRRPLLS